MADLVVFDPARVTDTSTYVDPTGLADGIEMVMLGGRFAVDGGDIVARDLGRVLRRPRK
jgi:N-acyl-D-amino-acid deacylase